jgi:Tol biopolymer transport system component
MSRWPDPPQSSLEVAESDVRSQLERILSSATFSRSDRLSKFLRFIVERALLEKGEGLKEQSLATELYARGSDFDAATDAVVRVDARRLRDKLREYYAENPGDLLVITLPKGGYVPSFENRPPTENVQVPKQTSNHIWKIAAAAAFTAILATSWLLWPKTPPPPPKLSPLTSYPGNESQPALSPDGNFVAFWCTEPDKPANQSDICVKSVGADAYRRLTDTPQAEYWPAWSPDGKEIAFGRSPDRFSPGFQEAGAELGIFIVPLLGGAERKVSDTGNMVAWMPDGKSLLIRDRKKGEPFAIYQLDLATQQRRRVTQPAQGDGDWRFDISPDGGMLAVIRFERTAVGDLFVVPMPNSEKRGEPLGEPRRLTEWNRYITGVAWTPDGKEIVYSLDGRLWRIAANLSRPGQGTQIAGIPMPAIGVSISRPRSGAARLAFHTSRNQVGMRRIDLASVGEDGVMSKIEPFAPATRTDIPGRFSPDGSRVAFASNRSSEFPELWIADRDGANAKQITTLASASRMLVGSWSPDGKQIVFDAQIQGNDEIYAVAVDGGSPRRLATGPAFDRLPEWSKDSRWIYYAAPAAGKVADIWRVSSVGGGTPERVTTGGFEPQQSPDGRDLYFLDRPPAAGTARLMKLGEQQPVLESVTPFLWCVADAGIYFLKAEGDRQSIQLYRFATKKTQRIGALPFRVPRLQTPGRFSVSRDGRWALVNVGENLGGDLMLIDDFR